MAFLFRPRNQGKPQVHPKQTNNVQLEESEDKLYRGSWISRFRNSFGLQSTLKQRVIISVVVIGIIVVLSVSIAIPLSVPSEEASAAASRGRNDKTGCSNGTTSNTTNSTANDVENGSNGIINGAGHGAKNCTADATKNETTCGATNDTNIGTKNCTTKGVPKDFRSCTQLYGTGFTNSGIYEILTPDNQTIKVYCDHGNTNGDTGWTMVFKVVSGVTLPSSLRVQGPSELWQSSKILESSSSSLPINSSSKHHYKNRLLEQWEEFNPTQVRLSLYKNKTEVVRLLFDGTGSTKTSWFSLDRLLSSPWTDLHSQPNNFFSIAGDIQVDHMRTFFINSEYDDCPTDKGWMALIEIVPGVCPWENHVQKYSILYSTNSTCVLWITTDSVSMADMMAIYIV